MGDTSTYDLAGVDNPDVSEVVPVETSAEVVQPSEVPQFWVDQMDALQLQSLFFTAVMGIIIGLLCVSNFRGR